ncbi:MAG: Uma2 family endonuclease [Prochlorothrix sp.]
MVQTPVQPLTLAAFLGLPETKPASEFIEGQIFQKPMPQGKHSSIQTELAALINQCLRQRRMGRAFTELRCTFGGRSIVPDIAVFEWSRIVRDGNGEVANEFNCVPDWPIEILSPQQSQTRVTKKLLSCLAVGAQLGWLIDPAERTVLVYGAGGQVWLLDEAEQRLPVPEFAEAVELTVAGVFGVLLD